tara:strand:- start:1937 stop:2131 length:195 start_codon:yes stop_codon:yes gene_type:complete
MKSMPIGRKKVSTCLDDSTKDQRSEVRRELEKRQNRWLKDKIESDKERVKRWEDEIAEDDIAPI